MSLRFALLAILIAAPAAHATTLMPVERTCPVGGAKFQSFEIGSTSQFGVRLDLRPVGPAATLPVEECPNGFVLWKQAEAYTAEETARLAPIVESAAYQALRQTEGPRYRIVHLQRQLGTKDADMVWRIMDALWEAEDAQNRGRHAQLLADAIAACEARTAHVEKGSGEWWALQLTAADLKRQSGRFEDALSQLAGLDPASLPEDRLEPKVAMQISDLAKAGDAAPAELKRDE